METKGDGHDPLADPLAETFSWDFNLVTEDISQVNQILKDLNMLRMALSKALHKCTFALNKHPHHVNKGFKKLSKPLKKALNYVLN